MIEIVSPGNKSNRHGIRAFREKIVAAVQQGIHLLILDLLPPTPRDPNGIHGLIWGELTGDECTQPPEKPLTFAAYKAGRPKTAYVQPLAVGDELPEMPLLLTASEYIPLALASSYQNAYEGVPRFYRNIIEATA